MVLIASLFGSYSLATCRSRTTLSISPRSFSPFSGSDGFFYLYSFHCGFSNESFVASSFENYCSRLGWASVSRDTITKRLICTSIDMSVSMLLRWYSKCAGCSQLSDEGSVNRLEEFS